MRDGAQARSVSSCSENTSIVLPYYCQLQVRKDEDELNVGWSGCGSVPLPTKGPQLVDGKEVGLGAWGHWGGRLGSPEGASHCTVGLVGWNGGSWGDWVPSHSSRVSALLLLPCPCVPLPHTAPVCLALPPPTGQDGHGAPVRQRRAVRSGGGDDRGSN